MFKNKFGLRLVASVTGQRLCPSRVLETCRVSNASNDTGHWTKTVSFKNYWKCIAYPTRPVTLATEQKPCPSRTTQFTYKIDNLTHLSRYVKKIIKCYLYIKYMY